MAAKNEHYVNNKQLLEAIIRHREAIKFAKKHKRKPPLVTEYIGVCFLKIAEHVSRKPNFMSYTFREDMISDAVENCIQYVDNFNPAKYSNPFAYFTQIIIFAFLRRISKEKKQLYVKYKATQQLGLLQTTETHDLDELGHGGGRPFHVYDNINDFIQAFEQVQQTKKRKAKRPKVTACSGTLRFIGDK
jgi:DNA-directed RNA polymerase specialized sigma subunit